VSKHLEASASVAIDWIQEVKAEQHKALVKNIDMFMNAPLDNDAYPDVLANLYSRINEGKLEDTIKRFAQARSFCASAIKGALTQDFSKTKEGDCLGKIYAELEPVLFKQIAFFEAMSLAYWDAGLWIDDASFNQSLKLLTALGIVIAAETKEVSNELALLTQAVNLVSDYYQKMDHLLAYHFNRSHHRKDNWVRIGPFSFSHGLSWSEVERPAIVLNEDQRIDFCNRIARSPSMSAAYAKPKLGSMIERIGTEPVAFSLYIEEDVAALFGKA
jgi:hypothetical protein